MVLLSLLLLRASLSSAGYFFVFLAAGWAASNVAFLQLVPDFQRTERVPLVRAKKLMLVFCISIIFLFPLLCTAGSFFGVSAFRDNTDTNNSQTFIHDGNVIKRPRRVGPSKAAPSSKASVQFDLFRKAADEKTAALASSHSTLRDRMSADRHAGRVSSGKSLGGGIQGGEDEEQHAQHSKRKQPLAGGIIGEDEDRHASHSSHSFTRPVPSRTHVHTPSSGVNGAAHSGETFRQHAKHVGRKEALAGGIIGEDEKVHARHSHQPRNPLAGGIQGGEDELQHARHLHLHGPSDAPTSAEAVPVSLAPQVPIALRPHHGGHGSSLKTSLQRQQEANAADIGAAAAASASADETAADQKKSSDVNKAAETPEPTSPAVTEPTPPAVPSSTPAPAVTTPVADQDRVGSSEELESRRTGLIQQLRTKLQKIGSQANGPATSVAPTVTESAAAPVPPAASAPPAAAVEPTPQTNPSPPTNSTSGNDIPASAPAPTPAATEEPPAAANVETAAATTSLQAAAVIEAAAATDAAAPVASEPAANSPSDATAAPVQSPPPPPAATPTQLPESTPAASPAPEQIAPANAAESLATGASAASATTATPALASA